MNARRFTILASVLAVTAAATLSARAEIIVPPGFVVDPVLDQIDDAIPTLEAIRNPGYGFGVVAASVDNGILKILRISDSSIDLLATTSGYPVGDAPGGSTTGMPRFDATGLFANELLVTAIYDMACSPPNWAGTDVLRVLPGGDVIPVASFGDCADNLTFGAIDFTLGSAGYLPGLYLQDGGSGGGSSLYHLDSGYNATILGQDVVPPGRTDLDIHGMEFDPTGLYGWYLTMADSDWNDDDLSVIYQLLPDLSWVELTAPVNTSERYYADMAFSSSGSFGQTLYVIDTITDTILTVDPAGQFTVFASGFDFPDPGFGPCGSITMSADGEHMFVSDANGVHRIHAATSVAGPTLVMREPWVGPDDVYTGDSGVDSVRLLWNEPILFGNSDVSITNEGAGTVTFSVSGSNSPFMIIVFEEALLQDTYTITVSDSAVSADSGAAIDGDNDGLAGGDAILVMTHRHSLDYDRDRDIDLSDLAALLGIYGTTWP